MFLVLILTRGWVDPRAMVRSEGNMSLKNPVTPPGIDPGTVRLVAQRLNHYATPGPKSRETFSFKHAVHRKRPAKAQTANSICKLPKYSVNGSSRFTVRIQLFYSVIKAHTVQTIYLFRPKLSKILAATPTSTRTPLNKYSPLTWNL
jgi:hypothetical protein